MRQLVSWAGRAVRDTNIRKMLNREPYSYLRDPSVPEFKGTGVFTVMDAHCALCARGARWIARHDGKREFTIIPVQSATGSALLRHYGMDPDDPASWLYLEEGRGYASLDAVMRAGARLGGVWKGMSVLRILPRVLRDALYRVVALNRYRVFGRVDLCAIPDADVQERLLR